MQYRSGVSVAVFTAERTLYPFQRIGRDRMVSAENMLVVMHMGLGKTRTTLAAIERQSLGRGLVICPASVKYQWAREILKTTDQKGLVIEGNVKQRAFLWEFAEHYKYVIISFATLLSDWETVQELLREFVIVDEVTNIKGMKSQRSKATKNISWRSRSRYGLSGQPVENRPEELFSAMEFVDDEVFGRSDIFDKTFVVRNKWTGKVQRYTNLSTLQKRIGPHMYRKKATDPDVAAVMPSVVHEELAPKLDAKSAALYEVIAQDVLQAIADAKSFGEFDLASHYGQGDQSARGEAMGEIMSRVLGLRMLCGDPELLRVTAKRGTNQYVLSLDDAGVLDTLPEHGNKLKERVDVWRTILEEDPENKIIVFSFFKPMLRIIQAAMKGYGSVTYDGDMTARQKDEAQLEFQTDPRCRLFLSSDAGGYGLNLKEARFLDIYDYSWSGGTATQRETRNVRIDSTFESVVHIKGPVVGSVEVWMAAVVAQKQAISAAFTDGKFDKVTGGLKMSVDSLSTFLRENTVR